MAWNLDSGNLMAWNPDSGDLMAWNLDSGDLITRNPDFGDPVAAELTLSDNKLDFLPAQNLIFCRQKTYLFRRIN